VTDDDHLLIFRDPHRFWDLVQMDDAKARFDGCKRLDSHLEFDNLVLCEIVRYGFYNRDEMVGPLSAFYVEMVMKLPEERRLELYRHVAGLVEAGDSVSINAFLPFIARDDSWKIVSTAVVDWVSLGPLTGNDPMSRVKGMVDMIEDGTMTNEGAAFGALLHIGDRRVCQLLLPLRDRLDRDALQQMVKCQSGLMYAATVDFYLDWLEGLEGDTHDRRFGHVAAGLGLVRKTRRHDDIFTGERPFPARGVTRNQLLKMLKPMKFADYLDRIAPRMYAIERAEPPPRIMPHVLAEWGLEPKTDPSETSPLDDRVNTRW
jgi:hypothetical protein